MTTAAHTTNLLLILDGWGHRQDHDHNAIYHAHTPHWDKLCNTRPHTLISTSGLDVGLPEGQMGNSEVGHMSIGSGRIIYQQMTKMDQAIADGSFFENPVFIKAVDHAISHNKVVHILGLLSPGGVHSHENHLFAMIKLAHRRGAPRIMIHAILDGRDTPPQSAIPSLNALTACCKEHNAVIASVIGRYYAMDRDKRWDRIEKAYALLTQAKASGTFANAVDAVHHAYNQQINDEFVEASWLEGGEVIGDGDSLIFMNFRADRARELSQAFVNQPIPDFRSPRVSLGCFVTATEYADTLPMPCAFAPEQISNDLPSLLQQHNKRQLRIAETEKYAHVTFFFSGGKEVQYPLEDRILVDSPNVETYDLKPEMSIEQVTDKLVNAIKNDQYDCIICNIANGDMVGHTGKFDAAIKAAEAIDRSMGKIVEAITAVNGQCLITADHGNCEQMLDYQNNQPHTQHTTGKVPLVYLGTHERTFAINDGRLADIAPSMLCLLGIPQPPDMTGRNLFAAP